MTTRGTPRASGKIRVGDHPIRLANNHFVEREFDWRSYQLGVNPRDPTCKWQERIGDHPNRLAKYHFVEREFDWRSYQLGANPRDPTCKWQDSNRYYTNIIYYHVQVARAKAAADGELSGDNTF